MLLAYVFIIWSVENKDKKEITIISKTREANHFSDILFEKKVEFEIFTTTSSSHIFSKMYRRRLHNIIQV